MAARLFTSDAGMPLDLRPQKQEMRKSSLSAYRHDYAGLATALLAARGIGELPLVVQPDRVRDSRLVEIMPDWRFRTYDTLCVVLLRALGSLA